MRRKYIILLLSIVLAGGVTGCGGTAGTATASTSSATTGSSAQSVASATTASAVKAAEITYDDNDKNEAWSEKDATVLTLSDTSTEIDGSGASESGESLLLKVQELIL
ncbi:hypothetical protein [Novisyntrophococcus fermenticellae]|uniref:hypothetical protein n=1 Tax=Novisyntrophococcus fermenticellae TaxID=2068655 RepID=UPI001E561436|nr:hypothetical protein [Novisyntrophococcus fermenticellae]